MTKNAPLNAAQAWQVAVIAFDERTGMCRFLAMLKRARLISQATYTRMRAQLERERTKRGSPCGYWLGSGENMARRDEHRQAFAQKAAKNAARRKAK